MSLRVWMAVAILVFSAPVLSAPAVDGELCGDRACDNACDKPAKKTGSGADQPSSDQDKYKFRCDLDGDVLTLSLSDAAAEASFFPDTDHDCSARVPDYYKIKVTIDVDALVEVNVIRGTLVTDVVRGLTPDKAAVVEAANNVVKKDDSGSKKLLAAALQEVRRNDARFAALVGLGQKLADPDSLTVADAQAVIAAGRRVAVISKTYPGFSNYSDVTFSVQRTTDHVELAKQDISLLHSYHVNLGLGVVIGNAAPSFAIANKMIQSDQADPDVAYDLMFEVYPWARVFDHKYEAWYTRFSLVGGFSLAHPTEDVFVGLGWEPVVGVTIAAGWRPRRVQQLKPGVVVGAANADSTIPTDTVWNTSSFGGSIIIDTAIAKSIVALFKP
jgi:hypothetical protein